MNTSDFFKNSWLINLDFREDRLEESLHELDKVGISVTRFSAIYQEGHKRRFRADGCAKSHISLLKSFKEDPDNDMMVVFEDDISFRPDFIDRMSETLDELNNVEWGIFFFYGGKNNKKLISLSNEIKRYVPTHAYAVKKSVVDILINKAEAGIGRAMPVDKAWSREYEDSLAVASSINLIIQRVSFSDIGGNNQGTTWEKIYRREGNL